MRSLFRGLGLAGLLSLFSAGASGFAQGFDSGLGAPDLASALALAGDEPAGGWVRIQETDLEHVPETRAVMMQLHAKGVKLCVAMRWSAKDWKRIYLPDDFHQAYSRGRKQGAAFGDLVDAWEIDNEPDLGFVPESAERYTALLKAMYLGLRAGSRERGSGFAGPMADKAVSNKSIVLMGSLGLPPGPWLERFAANDGFCYTDGFNYHYYGYAEDFSGVYRQFEDAVTQLGARSRRQGANDGKKGTRKLPVFLTEVGYGMLGKEARDTKEGRLRQWRWFKSVGEQASALHIEAPMAFYLQPYLEHDILEFGLTVPTAPQKPDGGSAEMAEQTGNLKPEGWIAGGISYVPQDFGAKRAAPWMERIGTKIDGDEITPALAQWMAMRVKSKERGATSKSWKVIAPAPSPVVIDFLNGEGLSFVKRFNGSFVVGKSLEQGAGSKEPETQKLRETTAKPTTSSQQPTTPPRSEEFMLHVRTANGNLYEVYPTRQATGEWQRYLEHRDNFTMSFYGRAELPWRFAENKPTSLVVVMYPKQLPATFEFRRVQLIKLGDIKKPETRNLKPEDFRYGYGKVVLYNFSEREITGPLVLPAEVGRVVPNAQGSDKAETVSRPASHETLTLSPGERREIDVTITVPADRYQRIDVPIQFVPEDSSVPVARFLTSFIPDIAGMKAEVAANLLGPKADGGLAQMAKQTGKLKAEESNRASIAGRKRATEEASTKLAADSSKLVAFSQEGSAVEQTADGFSVTVTARPPGKPQRVEIEIPWPDGLPFAPDEFLSVEFRLKP